MTTYVRSRDGGTVHRTGSCTYSLPPFGVPWHWADGRTVAEIRMQATRLRLSYRWCKRCFPELHRDGAS
jgi:hypothetical protein